MSSNTLETDTNEAELQQRFAEQLRTQLPLLPVSFQLERYLHLRLGHQDIQINGVPKQISSSSGRYDLLVFAQGNPLIMVEFKAPDVSISSADFDQALSYARLNQPPVPLTFITNGSESHLLYSSDGSPVEADDQQANALSNLLSKAATLASAPAAPAIETLLGTSSSVWQALCQIWSERHRQHLTGPIEALQFPLVTGYSVPREACIALLEYHRAGADFLLLHGPPLAGVTNTLAHFSRSNIDAPMLFVDTHHWPNVLQFLANKLSQELCIGVSIDQLRHWLNARQGLANLTLVLDGLPKEGFEELVDFARRKLLRLVVGMSTVNYQSLQTRSGRIQAGLLIEADAVVALKPFTDQELADAEQALIMNFNFRFQHGIVHTHELRWPRALRIIVAAVAQEIAMLQESTLESPNTQDANTPDPVTLYGFPGIRLLEASQKAFGGKGHQLGDLRRVAKVYIQELEQNVDNLNPPITQDGVYSIDGELAEEALGEKRLERLLKQELLIWQDYRDGRPRLRIPLEELLSHHIADEWAEQLRNKNSFLEVLDHLLLLTIRCPLHEVTLAAAIYRATQSDPELRGQAVQALLARPPQIIPTETPPELPSGSISFKIKASAPWLVLSYLAFVELAPPMDHLHIFTILGAFHTLINRLSQPETKNLERNADVYELRDGRLISSPNNGIIEPLQQAILYRSQLCPALLVDLAKIALQKNDPFLAGRILTVAESLQFSKSQALSEAAVTAINQLDTWFFDQLVRTNN